MTDLFRPHEEIFNDLVIAQRGMSDAEVERFLRTGEVPDLSKPPDTLVDVLTGKLVPDDERTIGDDEARLLLDGATAITAGALVAAARWKPEAHPRDRRGRFIEKGAVVDLLSAKKPTVQHLLNAVDELDQDDWDNLKPEQRSRIGEQVDKLPGGSKLADDAKVKIEKLGGTAKTMPEQTGRIVRRKTPGSVTYKFFVQRGDREFGPFATKASAQWKLDALSSESSEMPIDSAITKAAAPSPDGKLAATTVYKKHDDGTVVAESTDGTQRMRWDAGQKKYSVERRDGDTWTTTDSLNKGTAYEQLKEPNRWVTPGTAAQPAEKPATAPSVVVPETTTLGEPRPRKPTASWPFSYEEDDSVQGEYGDLAQPSDAAYEAHPDVYHLVKLPVSALVPTQPQDDDEWGDAEDVGMSGKPFAVDIGGNLYLIDGHHRARKAGPHGSMDVWVRQVQLTQPSPSPSPSSPSSPVTLAQGTPLKATTAYAKHDNGAVIARSLDGNRRLRWDGTRRKFIAERRDGDSWVEADVLTKGKTYEQLKEPGRWVAPGAEPGQTEQTGTNVEPPSSSLGTETSSPVVEPATTAPTSLPAMKITDSKQRDAIESYRVSGFIKTNRQLRTGVKQYGIGFDTDEQIAALDTALKDNALDRDVVLWRGTNVAPGDLTPGTVLSDKAFISTSLDQKQARHFAGSPLDANAPAGVERSPTLLRVSAPKGTSALNFGGGEREVLLPRDTKLEIENVIQDADGTNIVYARVVRGKTTDKTLPPKPTEVAQDADSPTTGPATSDEMRGAYDGGYEVEKVLTGGNTADTVQLVKLSDGTQAVRKRDTNAERQRKELFAAEVARAVGVDDYHVADVGDSTIVMTYYPGQVGSREAYDAISANYYVKKNPDFPDYEYREKHRKVSDLEIALEVKAATVKRPGAREIGILDWLLSNRDRREANWITLPSGHVRPIDHGNADIEPLTYETGAGNTKVVTTDSPFAVEWIGIKASQVGSLISIKPKVTKAELAPIRDRLEKSQSALETIDPTWYAHIMSQLELLEKKAPK